MMRPERKRAIVEQRIAGHAERQRGGRLTVTPSPRAAMRTISSFIRARERLRNRIGEIVRDDRGPGDLRGASVQPDGGAGGLECRHAHAPEAPRSSRRARRPCLPLASHAGAGGRKAQPAVGRGDQCVVALVDHDRAAPPRCLERSLRLRSGDLAEQPPELAFMRRDDGVLPEKALGLAYVGDGIGIDDLRRLAMSALASAAAGYRPCRVPREGSRCARR